jgi:hypothetical protein
MNALERVREKFAYLRRGTDITDKSPSVGFVSSSHRHVQQFSGSPEWGDATKEAREERAAIIEYDGGLPRREAERLAGLGDDAEKSQPETGEKAA